MSRLTHHISSDYFAAANKLKPKDSRQRIVAYVESYDDVYFWRTILSCIEDDNRYFEIMLPTFGHLGRGKKSAMKMLAKNTGRHMIACVDADYDYLIQGATETSRDMLSTPFVFHTFAYAIENLQCYAPGLHNVTVMATLNDKRIFDMQEFLRQYSQIVYPLLLWSVWLYRNSWYNIMSITDMDKVIILGKFSISNAPNLLQRLEHKVKQQIKILRQHVPAKDYNIHISALSRELETLGVTRDNAYMYIHGHFLFEKIVTPMLTHICSQLRQDRERQIRTQSIHSTQMNNELSCYANSIEDISAMLKKNTTYLLSPQCQQIIENLRTVFAI